MLDAGKVIDEDLSTAAAASSRRRARRERDRENPGGINSESVNESKGYGLTPAQFWMFDEEERTRMGRGRCFSHIFISQFLGIYALLIY